MFKALLRSEFSDTLCPGTSVPGTAALIVKFSTPAPLRESSSFCLLSSADECWRPCLAAASLSSANLTHRKRNIRELKCFKIHRCQSGGEFFCGVCKMKRDSFLCALFYRCWKKKSKVNTNILVRAWQVPFEKALLCCFYAQSSSFPFRLVQHCQTYRNNKQNLGDLREVLRQRWLTKVINTFCTKQNDFSPQIWSQDYKRHDYLSVLIMCI